MRHRLVIRLTNGSEVSGLYSWSEALLWIKAAAQQPDFTGFSLEGVGEHGA